MKHPFDLIGSRRAFIMIDALNNVLKMKNTFENSPTPSLSRPTHSRKEESPMLMDFLRQNYLQEKVNNSPHDLQDTCLSRQNDSKEEGFNRPNDSHSSNNLQKNLINRQSELQEEGFDGHNDSKEEGFTRPNNIQEKDFSIPNDSLKNVLNSQKKFQEEDLNGQNYAEEDVNRAFWSKLDFKIMFPLCLAFCWFIFDLATDVQVLVSNYFISSNISTELIDDLNKMGISYISIINSVPCILPSALLFISTMFCIPSLRHLIKLINIKRIMKDPCTETDDVQVNIKTVDVVRRYESFLVESHTESLVQIIFQWGSYMGLIYLIDRIMYGRNQQVNTTCIQDQKEIILDTLCHLNEIVWFRSNAPWLSGIASLGSITLAQYKANNVQHEYCTSLPMRAVYLLASFMNTLSHIFLLMSSFTTALDFNNYLMNTLGFLGYSSLHLHIVRSVFALSCLFLAMLLSFLARFFVFRDQYKIESWMKPKCFKIFKNMIKNTLKFFRLPTSQFSLNKKHCSFQSMINVETLKFYMIQTLLYIFFMVTNSIFLIINNWIVYRTQDENSFLSSSSPSLVSVSRRNFAIVSSVVIPMGWLWSNLFLWFYFKLDKGFFTGTNMVFKINDDNDEGNCNGEWEDLYVYENDT